MNSEAVKEICRYLVEEEITGRRLKKTSARSIRDAINIFLDWLGDRDMRSIGKSDLYEYHKTLCATSSKKTGEPLQSSTINDRFRSVCFAFSMLYRAGVIAENPTHNLHIDLPQVKGIKRRPLTREEINNILENLNPDKRFGLRDRTLFELIYSSGLRVGEAASLKIKDINFSKREIIVRGKGERDRLIPISVLSHDFLLLYLKNRLDKFDSYVFPGRHGKRILCGSISERFREILKRMDMDKKEICTHSIRHSTATHLLENGASVRHVQELLGHKSIETTVRYTHLQIEGIAKEYRKHHPREHELFETVDDTYLRRIDRLLELKAKDC